MLSTKDGYYIKTMSSISGQFIIEYTEEGYILKDFFSNKKTKVQGSLIFGYLGSNVWNITELITKKNKIYKKADVIDYKGKKYIIKYIVYINDKIFLKLKLIR